MSDFSRAYEGLRGENLTTPGPYTVNINFLNRVCVSEVLIQRTALSRGTSNVAQIEVVYKTANGTDLKASDGNTLVLKSPANIPTVTETSPRCDVYGIDLRILNTDDKGAPVSVRAMVMGCDTPSTNRLT